MDHRLGGARGCTSTKGKWSTGGVVAPVSIHYRGPRFHEMVEAVPVFALTLADMQEMGFVAP